MPTILIANIFLFLIFISTSTFASEVKIISFSTLLDPANLPATEIIEKPFSRQEHGQFVTGYFSGTVWVKIELKNETQREQTKVIAINYPLIDQLDIYKLESRKLIAKVFTGLSRGRASREIDSTQWAVEEKFKPEESKTLLLRASGNTSMSFPVSVTAPMFSTNKMI